MEFVLAYLASLLARINPCALPIVLAMSQQRDPRVPQARAAELNLSFVAFGTGIAVIGPAFGIHPEDVTRFAALVMVGFGAALVMPALGWRFASASAQ